MSDGASADGPLSLQAHVDELQRRVHRLERLTISAYCVIVAAPLIVGTFLPMFEDHGESWSVARTAFVFLTESDNGATSTEVTLPGAHFIIGFLGLVVVTLLLLVAVLPSAVGGSLRGRKLIFSRVLVGLGITGSLVPVFLTLMAIDSGNSSPGWGSVVLIVGMLATLPLVVQPTRSETERASTIEGQRP